MNVPVEIQLFFLHSWERGASNVLHARLQATRMVGLHPMLTMANGRPVSAPTPGHPPQARPNRRRIGKRPGFHRLFLHPFSSLQSLSPNQLLSFLSFLRLGLRIAVSSSQWPCISPTRSRIRSQCSPGRVRSSSSAHWSTVWQNRKASALPTS